MEAGVCNKSDGDVVLWGGLGEQQVRSGTRRFRQPSTALESLDGAGRMGAGEVAPT